MTRCCACVTCLIMPTKRSRWHAAIVVTIWTAIVLLNLALTRLLEVIGEAAAQLPDSLKQDYTAIPWREVTGLRNCLIHEYDEVDLDILWTIVQDDLPPLVEQLDSLLQTDEQR
jgi:uncharacterized protein with HEPN domain